jgi:D-alanyl-D-alanine carboxypeptidase (penicillin-binding protein 5/6)
MDFTTGSILFDYNADIPQSPASIVKMMAVYLVYEGIAEGRFTMDCTVPISQRAMEVSRDPNHTNVTLNQVRRYTVSELLDVVIVVSAGGATVALAEFVGGSQYGFLQMANDKADEWGIHAFFQEPHGGVLATFMSPHAMAVLTRNTILHFSEVLEKTGAPSIHFHRRHYNHRIPMLYPGMDGFKTGNHSTAQYNFAGTALRGDKRVITVVMGATRDRRFTDTAILLDYGFARVAEMNPSGVAADFTGNLP